MSKLVYPDFENNKDKVLEKSRFKKWQQKPVNKECPECGYTKNYGHADKCSKNSS